MFESTFLHFCHRALQEQVAAINAGCEAAEAAHRHLSALHAQRALAAARRPRRLKRAVA